MLERLPTLMKILMIGGLTLVAGVSTSSPSSGQVEVGIPRGPADPSPAVCDGFDPRECEDKATFTTSSFETWYGRWIYFSNHSPRILFNVQYDSDGNNSLDDWRFKPNSQVAVDLSNVDPDSTVAIGWIHASNVPKFYNPADQLLYKRVMYFVYQEPPSPTAALGRVCLSYSNSTSGVGSWTAPIAAIFSTSNPSLRGRACNTQNGEVLAEIVSGFERPDGKMSLFALHGDLSILVNSVGSSLTETYHLITTATAPDVIEVEGMVVSAGMQAPTSPGGDTDFYFRNLDATYDNATGKVYLSRVLPYPFDPDNSSLPCAPSGTMACPGGIALLPLRGQIYSMTVGTNFDLTTQSGQSWSLVLDIGDDTGWGIEQNGTCSLYPTVAPYQENRGIDVDSLTFHKTVNGRLVTAGGDFQLYVGGWPGSDSRKQSCVEFPTTDGAWRNATLFEMTYPIP